MRTDVAQPIRLADYRPPDYLIDRVDFDIRLDRQATRVIAQLKLRPNPQGRAGADLVLDGDGLKIKRLLLDGAPLDINANFVTPDRLTIAGPPHEPFSLEIETELNPPPTRSSWGFIARAPPIAPNARRKASVASLISSTGRTS